MLWSTRKCNSPASCRVVQAPLCTTMHIIINEIRDFHGLKKIFQVQERTCFFMFSQNFPAYCPGSGTFDRIYSQWHLSNTALSDHLHMTELRNVNYIYFAITAIIRGRLTELTGCVFKSPLELNLICTPSWPRFYLPFPPVAISVHTTPHHFSIHFSFKSPIFTRWPCKRACICFKCLLAILPSMAVDGDSSADSVRVRGPSVPTSPCIAGMHLSNPQAQGLDISTGPVHTFGILYMQ